MSPEHLNRRKQEYELTDCEPVRNDWGISSSDKKKKTCDLLKGTIQIAKGDLKKTPWSVMPPAAPAALLTWCCAEGCNSIERVRRGTDGGRSFSMCTHLQHSLLMCFFFLVYTSIANMLSYLLTCFCTNPSVHRSLFWIVLNLILISESLSQITCILIYDFSNMFAVFWVKRAVSPNVKYESKANTKAHIYSSIFNCIAFVIVLYF